MKWLTLKMIKQQLRMEEDFTLEDDLLELYGNSAEQTVLHVLNRTYDDVVSEYGEVPKDIVHATMLLVAASYEHRAAATMQNTYIRPYGFDLLVKPYMRLTSGDTNGVQTVTKGSDVKIAFTADLPDGLLLKDVDFNVKVMNIINDTDHTYEKAECIQMDEGAIYVALVDTDELGVGQYMLRLTVFIPDTDYPSGTRKEVININPHIRCIG